MVKYCIKNMCTQSKGANEQMLKSVIKHALKKFGAKKGQCLALACWLACSPELTPWSLFLTHALAVKLVQNHERTLSIQFKLYLFGPFIFTEYSLFKFGLLGRSYGHTNSVLRFLFIRLSGFGLMYPTRLRLKSHFCQ